jgi:hypothetical protein
MKRLINFGAKNCFIVDNCDNLSTITIIYRDKNRLSLPSLKQDYLAGSLRENAQRSVALTNYPLEEASFSAYPNSSRARHQ